MALFSQCHYDYIDFSITVGSETGTRQSNRMLRTWMKHLSDFMQTIDFVHARPATDWIVQKSPHVVDAALALPGGGYVAYLADDREVTDPNCGRPISGTMSLRIAPGNYRASFYSPTTGSSSPAVVLKGGDTPASVELAPFEHDVVLQVSRLP
jgi:hypothetical protein